ncbi:MAG: GAF domain-containing protein [Caldithrix sp.]|nr:GAF domain-containing protein [Caldithrix sp.]
MYRKLILMVLFVLICNQHTQGRTPLLNFDHLTIEDGLSQSSVYTILQDHRGFIWIGTQNGLNRYDGISIKIYYKNAKGDSSSVNDNWINDLVQDEDGFIWIATSGGGINSYNPSTEKFHYYIHNSTEPKSISSDRVTVCFVDSKNNLWVGTDKGLNRFDREKKQFIRYRHNPSNPSSISGDIIKTIYEDHQGFLWVGTAHSGLNRLDIKANTFTHFNHNADDHTSLSANDVTDIYEDTSNTLWVGTVNGLNKLNRQNFRFTRYISDPENPHSVSHNNIKSILCDDQGRLWIATYGGGLNLYDFTMDRFINYKHDGNNPSSLGNNFIWCLYEDNAHNLWLGTNDGVDKTKERRFAHIQYHPGKKHSLSNNFIWAVHEDRQGNIWIGTNDGLNRYDPKPKRIKHYFHDSERENSLSNNKVLSITQDQRGYLWIGTRDGGLNRLNTRTGIFKHFGYQDGERAGLSDNNVYCLYEDSAGNLWIGTDIGLNKYDPATGKFTHYVHDENDPSSLGYNRVRAIYEDHSGILWIGTSNGLNKFIVREQTFITYTVEDGLPNNVIYGLLPDKQDNLWLSTNRGLCRFNPKTGKVKSYGINDGLQSYEFNGGAYCKANDGYFYFGGVNGLNRFKPSTIHSNPYIPPVYITGLNIFNKPFQADSSILIKESITLNHTQNYLTFQFASLDYTNPDQNQYQYKLDGFDQQWTQSSNLNIASYTNLDPGAYVFKVKGSNSDGIFNETGAELNIIITPPFWQTWWFRIAMGILVMLAVFLLYRYRVNRIKHQRELLKTRVKQATFALKERYEQLQHEKNIVQRQAKQAALLNKVGKQISSELEINALLDEVVNAARDAFNYYGVMIMIMDEKQEGLRLQAIAGGYKNVFSSDLYVPVGKGMIGQAAITGETQMSNNVNDNPYFFREAHEITNSELCVPVLSGKTVIAVLDIQSDQLDAFDDDDISTMQTFSTQIASAITNARLYQQAQTEIKDRKKAEDELRLSHDMLAAAKKETDNIMENVEEGLFLINEHYEINAHYSKSLESILETHDIANTKLTKILENRLPVKLLASFEEYLELMFDSAIDHELIAELNPLSEVEVNLVDHAGVWYSTKYLAFNFKRIHNNDGRIVNLIVTLTDITDQKKLAAQLREAEADSKRQMEWLMSILHVEAPLLKEFLENMRQQLDAIDTMLKQSHASSHYRDLLDDIYGAIHLIKGNASLLDLKMIAEQAHDYEEKINAINKQEKIEGSDFVPLVIKLSEIRNMHGELTHLIQRISNIKTHFDPQNKQAVDNKFITSLQNLVSRVSTDLNKEVQFEYEAFNINAIPYRLRLALKNILIQLIRNSIYHGIELPEERIMKNKEKTGKIELQSERHNGHIVVRLRDDGQGLSMKKLRKQAIDSGNWQEEQIFNWSDESLAQIIFKSSISTAETANMHAGRGIGLNIIKKNVEKHNGMIEVRSVEDKFCEFTIDMPVSQDSKTSKYETMNHE